MAPDRRRPDPQTNQAEEALRPRRESAEERKLRGRRQPVDRPDDSGEVARQPDSRPDPRV